MVKNAFKDATPNYNKQESLLSAVQESQEMDIVGCQLRFHIVFCKNIVGLVDFDQNAV